MIRIRFCTRVYIILQGCLPNIPRYIGISNLAEEGSPLLLKSYYRCLHAAYQNFFSFFFISSYVGYVPVSDVLAIFVSDRRCEFPSKFSFVIKKKTCLLNKFWEAPGVYQNKTFLVNPKVFTKTCFFTSFLQCRWGCLYSITLFKSICSITTPTLAQHFLK